VLIGTADIVGSARIVSAAPRIALAAGYDVDADLDEIPVAAERAEPAGRCVT
jgi:hypothetical protein